MVWKTIGKVECDGGNREEEEEEMKRKVSGRIYRKKSPAVRVAEIPRSRESFIHLGAHASLLPSQRSGLPPAACCDVHDPFHFELRHPRKPMASSLADAGGC